MGLHDKAEKKFSVKDYVQNRPMSSRGVGAVQLPEGVQFYKFKETGTVRLDVVPYRMSKPHLHPHACDDTWYERTYFVHKNVGPDKATIICPKATFNKPCPICEYKSKLDYSDPEDLKKIKELNAQERQLFNVVVVDRNTNVEDPKIWVLDQSRFGFGKLLDDLIKNADEDDEHYQYFVDLKYGSTLKLNIEDKNTDKYKFLNVASIEIKPRKYQYDKSILDRTVDLDLVLQTTSFDAIKEMFFGIGETSGEDDSNWDQVKRLKKEAEESESPKSKPKHQIDEDDDDEPPVKPKKKVLAEEEENTAVRKKAKPSFDEDEDDEPRPKKKAVPLNDEDDEELPKPKKKVTDDDDEPKPKKKTVTKNDDEDDEPFSPVKPKSKVPFDTDEDDEPKFKKKAVLKDDDEDDDEPPAKSKPKSKHSVVEDWEDED